MPLIKRHIAKTISYRLLGTTTTIIVSYIAGLPIKWVMFVGLGELVIKPIIYLLHERIWYRYIKFGLKNK
jgi:uncharacterized membrane protein